MPRPAGPRLRRASSRSGPRGDGRPSARPSSPRWPAGSIARAARRASCGTGSPSRPPRRSSRPGWPSRRTRARGRASPATSRLPRGLAERQFPDLEGPGALGYAEWLRAHADRRPRPARRDGAGRDRGRRAAARAAAAGAVPRARRAAGRVPRLARGARPEAARPARLATWSSSTASARTCAPRSPRRAGARRPGPARRAATSIPLLGELLYASPERAGAGSFA